MLFKNHPFSSTMKKEAKKKKKPKDITLQAKLVWFVKMRSIQLYMQKAVRSDDSTLRSDAAILMPTHWAPFICQSVLEWGAPSYLPRQRAGTLVSLLVNQWHVPPLCLFTVAMWTCHKGSTWGNHPEGEFSKTSGQYFSSYSIEAPFFLEANDKCTNTPGNQKVEPKTSWPKQKMSFKSPDGAFKCHMNVSFDFIFSYLM